MSLRQSIKLLRSLWLNMQEKQYSTPCLKRKTQIGNTENLENLENTEFQVFHVFQVFRVGKLGILGFPCFLGFPCQESRYSRFSVFSRFSMWGNQVFHAGYLGILGFPCFLGILGNLGFLCRPRTNVHRWCWHYKLKSNHCFSQDGYMVKSTSGHFHLHKW